MKKIGIMGGTFNPIHSGHLRMAQAAYEQYALDEIWFMPSANPPHKENDGIEKREHRERMVRLAIDGISCFSFSDLEFKRKGITYTSDTLEEIHRKHPRYKLYFIFGGDSLESFDSWHEPETILKHCTILSAPRGDMSEQEMLDMCHRKGDKFGGKILPIQMERVQISSEQIRELLQSGHSVHTQCPERVECYIRLHGLYGCKKQRINAAEDKRKLLHCLASTLRPKRFIHTLGVAETAAALGFCHFRSYSDIRRAELAGFLHDCAKYFTGDEMIEQCRSIGIHLSDVEQANTALIHGKLGAFYAKERYGIQDTEILSAIACHTTGKPGMSTLEKIIYVADYIEPGRQCDCSPYPLEEIRRECFRNLDHGLYMILANTKKHLENSEYEIDPQSMETYEYYRELCQKKGEGR